MEIKNIFTCLFIAALSMAPVYAIASTTQSDASATVATSTPNDAQTNNDAEIIGWLIAVDNNEIAAAKLAKQKKVNHAVTKFANFMIKEHTSNLNATRALSHKLKISPADTDAVTTMEKNGEKEKSDLASLNGADFQKAYIDDMVNDHSGALTAIDGYLKTVSNAALKKHLVNTRAHVAHHLDEAKKIQSSLASAT